ncbi:MAG: 3-phosphoserine/phosphohydroxythreonine transaminase [Lentisphaerae bacterium]|nr:3-phosphoserine/phosphohydroxythreonine transaminase [Lentisphaerota bacterium]
MKVFNFNAGPATLPDVVMERAQKEFCDYMGSGCGIMEHSHRHKLFEGVLARANENIRTIMEVPENYDIVYIQGGASMQFAMIPMNLYVPGKAMEFADTGTWSAKAIKEAKLFGETKIIASSKEDKYTYIPDPAKMTPSEDASFFHITSNNTIYGTQYQTFPESKCPMLADMSSDIMSRKLDVSKFGMIYAGAQKNLGPSGMAVVIIRKDLVERTPANVPTMLRYATYTENDSLYNTPPTFGIYMLSLVTDWVREIGGIEEVEKRNNAKAALLYSAIDGSEGFYRNPVAADSRSKMNVIWRLPSEELEAEFVKAATAAGMIGLKGHRSAGGIRASIYNAMPMEGIEKLVDFMADFRKTH